MLFNSIDFLIFLPTIFVTYWCIPNAKVRLQNIFLIFASYFFYGWWDWRFLSLIVFSSFIDYFVGISLSKTNIINKRKFLLLISIFVNLGLLGFFKYYNFFLANFVEAFSFLGHEISPRGLNIILPVGISFYTFQTLSYTIDVYKKKFKPTKDIVAFFAFVSFFPQLVAGPIERATNLLPQFFERRIFEYNKSVDGLRQILWGFFKKIVIADNCAIYANIIFNNSSEYSGSTLLLGALFFTFQIYCDFSGYSDIAIGTSRLFGFDLMKNFSFPYFSRNIAEFWRRWHISLSTWFRDYLYIPLGGSQGGVWMKIRNTFIIFIVSGFWHGANWTFIVWGALNAIYILPLLLTNNNRKYLDIVSHGKLLPSFKDLIRIIITFLLTVFAWIFFRSEDINQAINYILEIFSTSIMNRPEVFHMQTILLVLIFILIEWYGREQEFAIANIGLKWKRLYRHYFYHIIFIMIIYFSGNDQTFIYFQF